MSEHAEFTDDIDTDGLGARTVRGGAVVFGAMAVQKLIALGQLVKRIVVFRRQAFEVSYSLPDPEYFLSQRWTDVSFASAAGPAIEVLFNIRYEASDGPPPYRQEVTVTTRRTSPGSPESSGTIHREARTLPALTRHLQRYSHRPHGRPPK